MIVDSFGRYMAQTAHDHEVRPAPGRCGTTSSLVPRCLDDRRLRLELRHQSPGHYVRPGASAAGPRARDSYLGCFQSVTPPGSSTADTAPPQRSPPASGRQPASPCFRRRDSFVIAGRALTLSWPAGAAGDPVGQLGGLDQLCVDGTLRYPLRLGESSGSWELTFSEVVRPQGRHTATFAWPSRDLRRTQLRSSARSSAGQSSCLLSSGSRVRILPGAPGQRVFEALCQYSEEPKREPLGVWWLP